VSAGSELPGTELIHIAPGTELIHIALYKRPNEQQNNRLIFKPTEFS